MGILVLRSGKAQVMQALINGSINGLLISILALGFTATYLPTRIFHIALGGIYIFVPFAIWECLTNKIPLGISLVIGSFTGVLLSLLCELLNHKFISSRKGSSIAHFVSSLGIYGVLIHLSSAIWGDSPKVLRSGIDPVFHLGNSIITETQLIQFAVAAAALIGFLLWLYFTKVGLQFRALASNDTEIILLGYNMNRLRLIAFGLAGLLASISGVLVAYDTGFSPQGGLDALMLAIVAMTVGGRNTFMGPILGGILLGIVRSEAVWCEAARWQQAISFFVMAHFLWVLPEGIFANKTRIESQT